MPPVTCPKCSSPRLLLEPQTFKDGKTHYRVSCAKCKAFVKFESTKEKKAARPKAKSRIPWPRYTNKNEVEAVLYAGLRQFSEARIAVSTGKTQLDLVVYDKRRQPLRIIEVWAAAGEQRNLLRESRELRRLQAKRLARYAEYSLPVDIVAGMANAKKYLGRIKADGFPDEPIRMVD